MTRSDLIAAGGQHIRTLHVNENGMTTNHSMCVEVVMVMGRYEAEERVTSMCYDKGCHVMVITTAGGGVRYLNVNEWKQTNHGRKWSVKNGSVRVKVAAEEEVDTIDGDSAIDLGGVIEVCNETRNANTKDYRNSW